MLTMFYNATNCTLPERRWLKQIIWNNLSTPGGNHLTFACNQVIATECQYVDRIVPTPKAFILTKNLTTMTTTYEVELPSPTPESEAANMTAIADPQPPEVNSYLSTSCFSASEEQKSLNLLAKEDRPDFRNISDQLVNQTYLVLSTYLDKKCAIEYLTTYLIADGSCTLFPSQSATIIRVNDVHLSVRKYNTDDCKGRPYSIAHYELEESTCLYQGFNKQLLADTWSFTGVYRNGLPYLDWLEEVRTSAAHSFGRQFPWVSVIVPAISILFL